MHEVCVVVETRRSEGEFKSCVEPSLGQERVPGRTVF